MQRKMKSIIASNLLLFALTFTFSFGEIWNEFIGETNQCVIDCTSTDARGTMDPNGVSTDSRGTMDPDGASTNSRGTMDPDGASATF